MTAIRDDLTSNVAIYCPRCGNLLPSLNLLLGLKSLTLSDRKACLMSVSGDNKLGAVLIHSSGGWIALVCMDTIPHIQPYTQTSSPSMLLNLPVNFL